MGEKEVGNMAIWQNHENRLTIVEVTVSNVAGEIKGVKEVIESGNKKSEDKLDAIDKMLMEEFFKKRRVTHETKSKIWLKVTGGLIGGGGLIYALYDIFTKLS